MTDPQDRKLDSTMKSAFITGGCSIAAALIGVAATWLTAAHTSGQKLNATLDLPPGFINAIKTGLILQNPSNPAPASFPKTIVAADKAAAVCPPPAKPQQEEVHLTPQSSIVPLDPGSEPEILKHCSGGSPLDLSRVFISRNGSGYRVAIKFSNPTADTISVLDEYANREIQLSTNKESVHASSGLHEADRAFTLGVATDDMRKKAFQAGLQIGPGDSTTITAEYANRSAAATQANVSSKMVYIVQDRSGQQTSVNRSLSCEAIPIYALSN